MSHDDYAPRSAPQERKAGSPEDDLEQEFYTALRAAGASPEEAQSCLRCGTPDAGR